MVDACQGADDPWRIGNEVLYTLCKQHPDHKDDAATIAKVWLIGRAYSAALERGRGDAVGAGVSSDAFYVEHVTEALRTSDLDDRVAQLPSNEPLSDSHVLGVLDTHEYLTRIFEQLTGKGKRSLASKYLHFHRPQLFFLWDSRASTTVGKLTSRSQPLHEAVGEAVGDPDYRLFVGKALALREDIKSRFHKELSPRQIDRLLLLVHARQPSRR